MVDESTDVDEKRVVYDAWSEHLTGDEVLKHGHHGKTSLELLHLNRRWVFAARDGIQCGEDLP